MESVLVAVRPFGRYAVGDEIRNTIEAAHVLASEHANHVVRVRMIAIAATVPSAVELAPPPMLHRREV